MEIQSQEANTLSQNSFSSLERKKTVRSLLLDQISMTHLNLKNNGSILILTTIQKIKDLESKVNLLNQILKESNDQNKILKKKFKQMIGNLKELKILNYELPKGKQTHQEERTKNLEKMEVNRDYNRKNSNKMKNKKNLSINILSIPKDSNELNFSIYSPHTSKCFIFTLKKEKKNTEKVFSEETLQDLIFDLSFLFSKIRNQTENLVNFLDNMIKSKSIKNIFIKIKYNTRHY